MRELLNLFSSSSEEEVGGGFFFLMNTPSIKFVEENYVYGVELIVIERSRMRHNSK